MGWGVLKEHLKFVKGYNAIKVVNAKTKCAEKQHIHRMQNKKKKEKLKLTKKMKVRRWRAEKGFEKQLLFRGRPFA